MTLHFGVRPCPMIHRSQKDLVEVSRCGIKMSTLALKFQAFNYKSEKSNLKISKNAEAKKMRQIWNI